MGELEFERDSGCLASVTEAVDGYAAHWGGSPRGTGKLRESRTCGSHAELEGWPKRSEDVEAASRSHEAATPSTDADNLGGKVQTHTVCVQHWGVPTFEGQAEEETSH